MVSKKLKRAGKLKGELINFATHRFPKAFEEALEEFKLGDEKFLILENEDELINPTDRFTLETILPDGRTIVETFVSERSDLSQKEREMVLSWQEVIEGIFQIDRVLSDGFMLYNLLNDLSYEAKPNMKVNYFPFQVGDYIHARIIPVDDQIYMFSGAIESVPGEGVEDLLQDFLMDHPIMAYKGNQEKIQEGFAIIRDQYQAFVEHFGRDEMITSGRKLPNLYQELMQHISDKGSISDISSLEFPEDLLEAQDVGFLFDEREGMLFLQGYRQFKSVFTESGKLTASQKNVVRDYLEEDTIPIVPFQRMSSRFPDRTQEVLRQVLGRPNFDLEKDFDRLMMEFKTKQVEARKYPSIAVIGERLAKLRNQQGNQPRRVEKVGRNDPCPCGSGKKYKYCCGR